MADQYVALPKNQEAEAVPEPSQSRLSGKVPALSVLFSLGCVALWASDIFNQPMAVDDATSLAMQPMKVMQPARFMPMQQIQSRNIMQPRAANNEVQGATTGPDPSRRSIFAGLAVLPMVAIADQANAAASKLKVPKFYPYFNYQGDLLPQGTVDVEGYEKGQELTWDLTGLDPKCASGTGSNANSCGVHIHKAVLKSPDGRGAQSGCKGDAGPHFFASKEDPWKSVTYKGTASTATVQVPTELSMADVAGREIIIHDFEGARVSCGVLRSGKAR